MIQDELTPREIVEKLDKYIIAQDDAKRAVAIALRNRVRRRHIPEDLKDEVIPKNILMIGPTGVGKTEIARRLANLVDAPFIKVEATKFTEVGYVGRDVESMIRDLTDNAYRMVQEEFMNDVQQEAERRAEQRLIDALAGASSGPRTEQLLRDSRFATETAEMDDEEAEKRQRWLERKQQQEDRVRQFTERRLRDGELEDQEVEIEVEDSNWQTMQVFSGAGLEEMGFNIQDMLGNMMPSQRTTRTMKIEDARRALTQQEAEKLVDEQEVAREAVERVEQSAIVFLDEVDKIAGREAPHQGPDVSREGVQRDILPIIEGSTVMTKYGPVKTNHILFIGAGAFHATKPSDLIPELQGRFPIRVELKSLSQHDFCRILTEPENSLIKQYIALLKTEDVNLQFTEDSIEQIAELAMEVNEGTENIGARRLYTMMEKLLDDVSFSAPESDQDHLAIDAQYVTEQLQDVVEDRDLTRYML